MLSQLPTDFNKVSGKNLDQEILRAAMIAELDAVSFYEQMAALATDEDIRDVLLDIAKEEKVHMAEFQAMLFRFDEEQVKGISQAQKEIKAITGK